MAANWFKHQQSMHYCMQCLLAYINPSGLTTVRWLFLIVWSCSHCTIRSMLDPSIILKFNYFSSSRFYFDFSATYVGVGMICPYIVNASLLIGGILSWGLMWPLISTKKGSWYSETLPESSLHGLQAYRVN